VGIPRTIARGIPRTGSIMAVCVTCLTVMAPMDGPDGSIENIAIRDISPISILSVSYRIDVLNIVFSIYMYTVSQKNYHFYVRQLC